MKRVLLALAVLAALIPFRVGSSAATFVAASANPGASFTTASDFNTVAVALADPGSPLRGSVTLSATAASERGIASVRFQTAPAGTSTWTDVCTDTVAPYSCSWETSGDGLRDVRALALDAAGYSRTSVVSARRVDNTAPAVTVNLPSPVVRDTTTLTATVDDGAGTGVSSVRFQVRPSATGIWIDVCPATSAPFTCGADTNTAPDGVYEARAIATDGAGFSTTSALVSGRIDNSAPSASMTDPGSPLSGTVNLTATATDSGSTIASVRIERAAAGSSTWTEICTDTVAPFGCAWATSSLADGLYDLRAVATDGAGNTTASATIANRRADNTAPRANDVQAVNGTGAANRIDAGDVLTFTYSEAIAPNSILAGWTGSSTAVTVRLSNSGSADTLAIWNSSNTTRLALTSTDLQLRADHVNNNVLVAATMTLSGSQVIVTFGSVAGTTKPVSTTTPMVWTPSTAATDVAGNPVANTTANESGARDRDF